MLLSAEAEPNRDPGLFEIVARVRKPEDLPVVRGRIAAALAEAARTPIDPARLDRDQGTLRYEFAGSLDIGRCRRRAVGKAVATHRPARVDQ